VSDPVPPRRPEAWTIFGRWRRPSPLGRAIGVALLLISLALTVWWAAAEPRVPPDGADGRTTPLGLGAAEQPVEHVVVDPAGVARLDVDAGAEVTPPAPVGPRDLGPQEP
jgi:hypothetical protein